jgi:signal transduction histidine kinase
VAMNQLEANTMTLKDGGTTSGVNLKPLSPDFLDLWNKIERDWNSFKTSIVSYILKPEEGGNPTSSSTAKIQQILEGGASSMIRSSDSLVTKLGGQVDANSKLMVLQVFFGALIIGILVLILYIVTRILRPIFRLTEATSKIKRGNLETLVEQKGTDELAILTESFNSMIRSIKGYIENQNELNKTVKIKNEELLETEKDLRRANEDLINTERAKEEFISMISHELKTPLTPIKLYSEMFLRTKSFGELNEKQARAMKMINNSISQLEMLVDDVFDVYKLEIGRLRMTKSEVDVEGLIKENVLKLQHLMKDKKIELKAEVLSKSDGPKVFCDERRISQVLANLVKNSVDFVPANGGKITIRAEAEELGYRNNDISPYVAFTISDNGSGIPPEKIDKLFKKFYQIDTSVSRKYGGSGLGLAICEGIIHAHGGRIWVDEHTDGGGASIKFTLPSVYSIVETENTVM